MAKNEKIAPNLVCIPIDLCRKLLAGVDFVSLQSLRKSCRILRDHIDEDTTKANLYDVTITADSNSIFVDLSAKEVNGELIMKKIEYKKHPDGCFVICGTKKKFVEFENYAVIAATDLISVLKHHKCSINHFHVEFPFSDSKCEESLQNFEVFLSVMKEHLESRVANLKVKRFHMEVTKLSQLLNIYQYLDASVLERTSICRWSGKSKLAMNHKYGKDVSKYPKEEALPIKGLLGLEQWKLCKDIFIDDHIVTAKLHHFLHVTNGSILLKVVSLKTLEIVKKHLRNSENFRELTIHYHDIKDQNKIETRFGQWVAEYGEKCLLLPGVVKNRYLHVTFSPKEKYFCFTFIRVFVND